MHNNNHELIIAAAVKRANLVWFEDMVLYNSLNVQIMNILKDLLKELKLKKIICDELY